MTDDDTLADVNHVHPETSETFWGVYRRGPAMADGGRDRARRNGASSASTAGDETARSETAEPAPGTDVDTMADVSHEPPYPEPNDVWTRGFERPSDAGSGV